MAHAMALEMRFWMCGNVEAFATLGLLTDPQYAPYFARSLVKLCIPTELDSQTKGRWRSLDKDTPQGIKKSIGQVLSEKWHKQFLVGTDDLGLATDELQYDMSTELQHHWHNSLYEFKGMCDYVTLHVVIIV